MMGAFGGTGILIVVIIYLLPFLFMVWMIFRFVKAHEKIADGIYQIKGILHKMSNKDSSKK